MLKKAIIAAAILSTPAFAALDASIGSVGDADTFRVRAEKEYTNLAVKAEYLNADGSGSTLSDASVGVFGVLPLGKFSLNAGINASYMTAEIDVIGYDQSELTFTPEIGAKYKFTDTVEGYASLKFYDVEFDRQYYGNSYFWAFADGTLFEAGVRGNIIGNHGFNISLVSVDGDGTSESGLTAGYSYSF